MTPDVGLPNLPGAGNQAPTSADRSVPNGADLQLRLAAGISISDDDRRDLTQARARALRDALLQSGAIAADRVFVLAPKPVDRASKGEARGDFALE